MRHNDVVTISTHLFPHDANLAMLCARLDEEGIPYALNDQLYVTIAPLESLAVGGVKLRSLPAYEARIRELMAEMEGPKPKLSQDEVDPEDAAWLAERFFVPSSSQQWARRWVPTLVAIVLGVALIGLALRLVAPPQHSSSSHISTPTLP